MKRLPIFILGILVAIGTFWSFGRGGQDFSVFYEAWKLVIQGHGTRIYVESPDRFLYAPGFAWVLSPLAFLPKSAALGAWNIGKAFVIFALIQMLGRKLVERSADTPRRLSPDAAAAIAAGGFLLIARPLLIDLQYGQINTYILGASVWALLTYFSKKPSLTQLRVSWFLLGIVAVSKLFALPLLLVPYFGSSDPRRSRTAPRAAKISAAVGVLLAAGIPVLTLGFSGAIDLFWAWRQALLAKGLPFESHNQSFIALLDHYFTSTPTHVIALGWQWIVLGHPVLSLQTITELALGWSFLFMGILLAWIVLGNRDEDLRWSAVAVALLFIPSYLVWKPYFVLSYPLAVLILWQYGSSKKWLLTLGFVATNLTGFDLMGGFWAARLEAASIFLLVHLAYLACVFWGRPDFEVKPSPKHMDLKA